MSSYFISYEKEMRLVSFGKSTRSGKKYMVILEPKKTIHFGADGYDDYTTHHDDARKAKYIQRHASREDWNDPLTAGFWSRWILWNKKTVAASVNDVKKRFSL